MATFSFDSCDLIFCTTAPLTLQIFGHSVGPEPSRKKKIYGYSLLMFFKALLGADVMLCEVSRPLPAAATAAAAAAAAAAVHSTYDVTLVCFAHSVVEPFSHSSATT